MGIVDLLAALACLNLVKGFTLRFNLSAIFLEIQSKTRLPLSTKIRVY